MHEGVVTGQEIEGLFLVDKPQGKTSFSLIRQVRRLTGVKKVGHAGTLDPFATGVMVLLIGRPYTRLSDKLLTEDKEYLATLHLGVRTDTFDCDGKVMASSKKVPSLEEIEHALSHFQGEIQQTPPMFSAKKVKGKKLYELARAGIEIPREPMSVSVKTTLIEYSYPRLFLEIACSKGTYIRSIADELGTRLGCGAHLSGLRRTRSGQYRIEECLDGVRLEEPAFDLTPFLKTFKDL